MIFKPTKIKGVYLIQLELKEDERGYFARVFCQEELKKISYGYQIVQINRSLTKKKGTIRGLHLQTKPKQEDKIVQCLDGAIFDVAVDLRKRSKTYGQWVGEELSAKNKKMMLVPKGFAHGFQTLKANTCVQYFVSQFYSPKYEVGIRWNDPFFNIKWPISKPFVSQKDTQWPLYK